MVARGASNAVVVLHRPAGDDGELPIWNARKGLLEQGEAVIDVQPDDPIPSGAPVYIVWGWGKPRHQAVSAALGPASRVLVVNHAPINRELAVAVGWDDISGRGDYCTDNVPMHRFSRLGITPKPWTDDGDHIVLACQMPFDGAVRNIDIIGWCNDLAGQIRSRTDRRVIFRPHPLSVQETPDVPGTVRSEKPLHQDLENAFAVVTYSSTSAGLSVLYGIPVIAFSPICIAWPVAGHSIEQIKDPPRPSRGKWLAKLGYMQWSYDELKAGTFWEHLKQGRPSL